MSRTLRIRPTGAAAVIGVMIGAVTLAGCGAGQLAQTARQVAAVSGATAGAGDIAIRDAVIEHSEKAEGGDIYARNARAPLSMSIINVGAQDDELLSASSPIAVSVQISGYKAVPAGQTLVVEGEGEPLPAPTTAGATPTAFIAAAPTTASEGSHEAHIVLTGLRTDVHAGLTYELVLTFRRAGEIRFVVPVGDNPEPREDAHAE